MRLYKTQFGSQVYGTVTPTSDIDIGVVTLESPLHIYGLKDVKDFPQIVKDGVDTREFWLKRFLLLCTRGNPNVLEYLYTPESHVEYCHPIFREHILENAFIFMNFDKCIQSHLGFAKSQIMKMRNFNDKLSDRENEVGAKRRALIAQHGYDTKYASHAIRLIYQLTDILEHGTIRLPYEGAVCDELLAIKLGEISIHEFDKLYADRVAKVENVIRLSRDHIDSIKPNHKVIASVLEAVYKLGWADENFQSN